jgi:hypothetical protein
MNDEAPNSDPHEEPLANHLRSLEESLLDPELRRDRSRVSPLLADDFLEFGSSGGRGEWGTPENPAQFTLDRDVRKMAGTVPSGNENRKRLRI